jgi:hypothetical protein
MDGDDFAHANDAKSRLYDVLVGLPKSAQTAVASAESVRHETRPAPRFTEGSLVKALEHLGIGRPSTYASIIDTLQQRFGTSLVLPAFLVVTGERAAAGGAVLSAWGCVVAFEAAHLLSLRFHWRWILS